MSLLRELLFVGRDLTSLRLKQAVVVVVAVSPFTPKGGPEISMPELSRIRRIVLGHFSKREQNRWTCLPHFIYRGLGVKIPYGVG